MRRTPRLPPASRSTVCSRSSPTTAINRFGMSGAIKQMGDSTGAGTTPRPVGGEAPALGGRTAYVGRESERAEARHQGCLALTGRCYETEGTQPFIPWVENVEPSASIVPRAAFREALGDAAPEVAKIVPELRPRTQAPIRRDRLALAKLGEPLHVDLLTSRFVRDIRDPLSVWRDYRPGTRDLGRERRGGRRGPGRARARERGWRGVDLSPSVRAPIDQAFPVPPSGTPLDTA